MKLRELEQILRGIECKLYFSGFSQTVRIFQLRELNNNLLDREVLRIDLDTNEIQLANAHDNTIMKYCSKYDYSLLKAVRKLDEYIYNGFTYSEAVENVLDEIVATS